MTKRRQRHCDECGEDDGKLKTVVLSIGAHWHLKKRLCTCCRAQLIVAVAAPPAPNRR